MSGVKRIGNPKYHMVKGAGSDGRAVWKPIGTQAVEGNMFGENPYTDFTMNDNVKDDEFVYDLDASSIDLQYMYENLNRSNNSVEEKARRDSIIGDYESTMSTKQRDILEYQRDLERVNNTIDSKVKDIDSKLVNVMSNPEFQLAYADAHEKVRSEHGEITTPEHKAQVYRNIQESLRNAKNMQAVSNGLGKQADALQNMLDKKQELEMNKFNAQSEYLETSGELSAFKEANLRADAEKLQGEYESTGISAQYDVQVEQLNELNKSRRDILNEMNRKDFNYDNTAKRFEDKLVSEVAKANGGTPSAELEDALVGIRGKLTNRSVSDNDIKNLIDSSTKNGGNDEIKDALKKYIGATGRLSDYNSNKKNIKSYNESVVDYESSPYDLDRLRAMSDNTNNSKLDTDLMVTLQSIHLADSGALKADNEKAAEDIIKPEIKRAQYAKGKIFDDINRQTSMSHDDIINNIDPNHKLYSKISAYKYYDQADEHLRAVSNMVKEKYVRENKNNDIEKNASHYMNNDSEKNIVREQYSNSQPNQQAPKQQVTRQQAPQQKRGGIVSWFRGLFK